MSQNLSNQQAKTIPTSRNGRGQPGVETYDVDGRGRVIPKIMGIGGFVRFADYAKLLDRCEVLERRLAASESGQPTA